MAEAGALTGPDFARLLRPLLPETPERLAVAVSGGADSMALALLAHDWAQKRKIALTALIVDHRLRRESAVEARRVAGWLKQRGIAHRILVWTQGKPAANLQAAARAARYALLQAQCRRLGIGHLLLAHHRDDQAETLLLRAMRGSGVDGMAGMAPARLLEDGLVLLRPLLDIPKARLVATLRRRRQDWVEDPSNADRSFARVRVRQALDALAGNEAAARAELVTHLAQTAANLARARAALGDAAHGVLRAATIVMPSGIAWLDPAPLREAADEVSLRALARLLMAIGGQALPPRLERLERLLAWLRAGAAKPETLHRCALRPAKDGGRILVCREARHLPAALPLRAAGARSGALPREFLWDGRFRVILPRRLPAGLTLAPLGAEQPPGIAAELLAALPRAAWPGLPALRRGSRLVAVPGLNWGRMPPGITLVFRPAGADRDMDANTTPGAAARLP